MMRNALLAAGIVLSSASQLRIPGSPVGAGELCLALWIVCSASRALAGGKLVSTPAFALLGSFWLVFALAQSVGASVGLLTGAAGIAEMGHDAGAYLLMAIITCLASAEPDAASRLRQTAWLVVGFGSAGLAIQIAIGWGLFGAGAVEAWYWDRFRGWSENPNQAAIYCIFLGPLALHLGMSAGSWPGAIAGLVGAILPFVAGRLTKSDTFLLASALVVIVLAGLRLRNWLMAQRRSLKFAAAFTALVAGPPLAVSLLPYAAAAVNDAESLALSLTKDGGGEATVATANLRLRLWQDALQLGAESASLGLGPGPHLNPPYLSPDGLPRPFEAHNTYLDLYMQGGAIAIVALLFVLGRSLFLALNSRLDGLVALLGCLLIFSISHFILRHPLLWFTIALCAAEANTRATSPLPGLTPRLAR